MKGSKVILNSLTGQTPDAIFRKAVNMVLQEEAAKSGLKNSSPLHSLNSRSQSAKTKIRRKISKGSQKRNRQQKK